MHIRNGKALTKFQAKHPLSRKPIERWINVTSKGTWTTLVDVKKIFPAVDYVNGKYIFNIGGNNYRLVTYLEFTCQTVTILSAFTHDEYSKLRL